MKITYAGITLVDDSIAIAPGSGWQFVAQQLVGTVNGVGRVSGTPTPRGNRQRPFGGSALRTFDTHAAAVEWAGKHEAELPGSGDLVISVGGTAVLTYAGAVFETVQIPMPTGVSVTVTYSFRLAGPAT